MFYSVFKGNIPGIYNTWEECNKQVHNFKGAKYKKFSNYSQAEYFSKTGLVKQLKQSNLDKFFTSSKNIIEIKDTPILHTKISDIQYNSPENNSPEDNSLEDNSLEDNISEKKINHIPKKNSDSTITIYTDGACPNNGKSHAKAGIGIYFGTNDYRNRSERVQGLQTNNVAEITAIIAAIKIVENELQSGKSVNIHTDSKYSIRCCTTYGKKCIENNWKKPDGNPIPNLELVKEAYLLCKKYKNVKLHYVEAHTGRDDEHSIGNENADRLANEALGIYKQSQSDTIYLKIPYEQKDEFKKLYKGKWDAKKKKWSIPSNHPKKQEILEKYK